MRYTTSSEHQDYFSKQGMIEFEELLSAKEIEELEMKTEELLAKRMACTPAKLEYQTAKNLFLAGRNMWREDAIIKKIVMHQRFVDLAFSTLHAPRLRLAYDECIRTGATGWRNLQPCLQFARDQLLPINRMRLHHQTVRYRIPDPVSAKKRERPLLQRLDTLSMGQPV